MPLLLQVWKIHNSCGGFDNEQDNKYIFNAFKFAQLIFFGRKWPVTVKNRAVKNTILLAEISDGAYSTINGFFFELGRYTYSSMQIKNNYKHAKLVYKMSKRM